MQEDDGDGSWTDEAHSEKPETVNSLVVGTPIGEFVAYQFLRYHPSYEEAGKKCSEWQENLCRETVAYFHDVHIQKLQLWHCSYGE